MPKNTSASKISSLAPRAAPARDTVEIEDARLRHEYLPEAIQIIVSTMRGEGVTGQQYDAAKWIAERYIRKSESDGSTAATDIAVILAKTLRELIPQRGNVPALEGTFREVLPELGKPVVLGRPT